MRGVPRAPVVFSRSRFLLIWESVTKNQRAAHPKLISSKVGERCAAFINTDLRSALQQGAQQEDVIAGLVYSIAENYVTRIVGRRALGDTILFREVSLSIGP